MVRESRVWEGRAFLPPPPHPPAYLGDGEGRAFFPPPPHPPAHLGDIVNDQCVRTGGILVPSLGRPTMPEQTQTELEA